jgi:Flp pilus assembly protein TadG
MRVAAVRVKNDEQGASLIETALCFGVLASLLIGAMMTGMLLFSYHFISEAAREGTRYAMVRGSMCSSWSTACPASGADVQNYVRGLDYPIIDSTKLRVTTTWAQGNSPGNPVQVQVRYPFTLSIPFVRSSTVHMSSTSAMVISR